MKLVFVYYAYENQGSQLDLQGYTRAAQEMGHEVTVYGPPSTRIPLNYSLDLSGADAVVFVFEWTTSLQHGDRLTWLRLLNSVPRDRRIIIDCDGQYNDLISVNSDFNHRTDAPSRAWIEFCDELSDKICQPTPRPLRANVRPFLFHIYDPIWERPLDIESREFGMVYVGHSKFRWHGMSQVLRAVEPIRDAVGRIALFGHGWSTMPDWASGMGMEDVYQIDAGYMEKLRVEPMDPIPFGRVIDTMSRGRFNPVVYRPLFEHLDMVTCRTFETPAAGTVPLFLLNTRYVREVFGAGAEELVLTADKGHEKIADVMARPEHYAEIVKTIRAEFAERHSPNARLRELIGIIES
jgi:hypothetical protein